MMNGDWKCSDPEILESLRAEPVSAPSVVKQRILRRLAIPLDASNVAALSSEGGGAFEGRSAASLGAASTGRGILARPTVLLLAFVGGTGAGAAAYHFLRKPVDPTTVHIVTGTPAPTTLVEAMRDPPPAASPSSPETTPIAAAPSSARQTGSVPRRSDADDPAFEQALLDRARIAFARGENEPARRAIAEHRRRYPKSALAEERDALTIRVLAAQGRYVEARARETRFIEHYPQSIHLTAIRNALSTIP